MVDNSPSKRARSNNGTAQFLSLDSLLEERVRQLVANELSFFRPQNDNLPSNAQLHASALPAHAEDMTVYNQLESQRVEIDRLKEEISSMRESMKTLKRAVDDLQCVRPAASSKRVGAAPDSAHSGMSEILSGNLILKVGSRKFQTTADTLRMFPESFFGSMVSGRIPQRREKDGSIFIDRNPKHFSFVLDFLRSAGEGFTPPTSTVAQDELRAEADFYGLPELVALLRRLHVAVHHLMTLGKKGSMLSGNKLSAAMLDVKDPSNFAVTVALNKFAIGGEYPIFVGIGPMGTNLAQDWSQKSEISVSFPPAVKHGLFFGFTGSSAQGAMISGDFISHGRKSIKGAFYEAVDSVRVAFNRDSEVTRISFHAVAKGETSVWETNLSKVGLAHTEEYRPMLFLNCAGSVTISEIST